MVIALEFIREICKMDWELVTDRQKEIMQTMPIDALNLYMPQFIEYMQKAHATALLFFEYSPVAVSHIVLKELYRKCKREGVKNEI